MVHTRKGRQIPPDVPAASCSWGHPPHLTQRGHPTVFSTVLVLTVLQEIMTETGFLGQTSSEACGRSLNSVKQVHNSVKQVLNSVKHGHNSVKQVLTSVKHGHKLSKTGTKPSQTAV